jgi:hypothetical protein
MMEGSARMKPSAYIAALILQDHVVRGLMAPLFQSTIPTLCLQVMEALLLRLPFQLPSLILAFQAQLRLKNQRQQLLQ